MSSVIFHVIGIPKRAITRGWRRLIPDPELRWLIVNGLLVLFISASFMVALYSIKTGLDFLILGPELNPPT